MTPLELRVLRVRQQVIRRVRRELGIQGRTGRALHVWRGYPLIYGATIRLGSGGRVDVKSNTWVANCMFSGPPPTDPDFGEST